MIYTKHPVLPAVILAGGLGTRLGILTTHTPKSLVEVSGRPFLHWLLSMLAARRVREVLLLIGHFGDQIKSFVGNGRRWGLTVEFCKESTPLGTGGALRHAYAHLPTAFVLVYGDSYLPIDYAQLSHQFKIMQVDVMMAVYRDSGGITGVAPNVRMLQNRRVVSYQKTISAGMTHIDAGAVALSRAVVLDLPQRKAGLEETLYPKLVSQGSLWGYPIRQRFYDIGTTAGLDDMVHLFSSEQAESTSTRTGAP